MRSGSSGPFQLNDRQRAAVEYTAGPLLVLAGAGSGKTRVIIEKIAWLVQRVQTPPQRIAAITFTNKAAREMKVRLERRLGADAARRVRLSTFHSLGWAMVREHCTHLGLRPGISILDESDSQTVVRDLLPEGTAPEVIRMTRAGISRLKNRALEAGESQLQADSAGEVSMSRLYLQYDQHLRNLNAVDFDDLILLPLQLLRLEEVRACWQERIRYTLVDEYQDTNEAQYRMLRVLAGDNGRLTVVGDDDQSIYGWRGAQPENIDRLAIDYPALKMIKLEQNYRSCGRVLKAANALIAHNPHNHEKRLWSALGEGEPIRVLPCESETAEAATVASDILHRKYTSRAGWGDFAVLYRGNHQSRPLEKALREQKIPYHLSGGTSFFDRSEIKDLMCYLRLAVNPDDNTAFLRVVNTPRRDIGVSTRGKIAIHAGAHRQSLFDAAQSPELLASLKTRTSDSLKAFSRQIIATGDRGERSDPLEAVRDLYKWTAYDDWLRDSSDSRAKAEKRIENVREFIAWLDRLADDAPGSGLVDLLGKLSLLTGLDQEAEAGQEVRLMTLHGAKGLEFPHVFLVGVEEDLLPHRNSIAEDTEHEERRLMYVGMTRARESLTLSYAARRRSYGDMVRCKPSRFLDEIPAELIERRGDDPTADKALSRERGRAHMEKLKELFGD
jgi:ATP-dependent DNA helicase Rep